MLRVRPAILALLGCLSVSPAFSGGKLLVTQATWKAERSELLIEGTSDKVDDVVLLRDAATKAFVGSAAVRRDGKWLLKVKHPNSVPARLTVVCGKDSKECTVEKVDEKVAQAPAQ